MTTTVDGEVFITDENGTAFMHRDSVQGHPLSASQVTGTMTKDCRLWLIGELQDLLLDHARVAPWLLHSDDQERLFKYIHALQKGWAPSEDCHLRRTK